MQAPETRHPHPPNLGPQPNLPLLFKVFFFFPRKVKKMEPRYMVGWLARNEGMEKKVEQWYRCQTGRRVQVT